MFEKLIFSLLFFKHGYLSKTVGGIRMFSLGTENFKCQTFIVSEILMFKK